MRRRGEEIALTAKEFQVLEVFMRHPDHVLTRYQLLEGAWDSGYEHHSNVSRSTSGTCAKSSTARSASSPSKPSVAPATASARNERRRRHVID